MARGRKRTIAGWGLIGTGLALAVLLGVSRWFWTGWLSSGNELSVQGGAVVSIHFYGKSPFEPDPWPRAKRLDEPRLEWWRDSALQRTTLVLGIATIDRFKPRGWAVIALLWPWTLTSLTAGWFLRRSGVKARIRTCANLCPACRYDRTGLGPDQACPECGQTPTPAPPAAS